MSAVLIVPSFSMYYTRFIFSLFRRSSLRIICLLFFYHLSFIHILVVLSSRKLHGAIPSIRVFSLAHILSSACRSHVFNCVLVCRCIFGVLCNSFVISLLFLIRIHSGEKRVTQLHSGWLSQNKLVLTRLGLLGKEKHRVCYHILHVAVCILNLDCLHYQFFSIRCFHVQCST